MNNHKEKKKIGFISAFSICFTSIVGIGIFLKNAAVGANVEGNGIAWLFSWIITGLLSILLAFHFGKISAIKSKNGITGLNLWIHETTDVKNTWFKKISSINYGLFYHPILLISLSFFTTEFFIEIFKPVINVEIHLGIYAIITICFLAFFVLNNYFSIKFSSHISFVTSILKIIPLIMVIIIGISFFNQHNSGGTNGFQITISPDKAIQGIMLSIPGVLFSFDSFIGIGSWSNNIKGGEKAVSRVIIFALVFVTVIYSLICIASIFHYNSDKTTILNVLLDSLPQNVKLGITIFITITIFISAFGTTNSICGSALHEYNNLVIRENIFFINKIKSKFNNSKSALISFVLVVSFWSLIILIPSIIINHDGLIDGFSNLVVVAIFPIYAYLIFLYWKNIYLKSNKNNKYRHWYAIAVWVALIWVLLAIGLNIYFVLEAAIKSWNASYDGWGLSVTQGIPINNLNVLILYIVFFAIFFSFPFINFKIIEKRKMRQS
ncbi:APC family permease [Metamycoplasma sualvi]|uniref:APC family permease n=1 Tax=Metamycoplasma sualvi TaxID=2125 RepID=UPI003872A9DC